MRRFFISIWTWFNAVIDRRHELPRPDATALSHTESELCAVVNATIASVWKGYRSRAAALEGRRAHLVAVLRDELAPEFERVALEAGGRRDVDVSVSAGVHVAFAVLLLGIEAVFNAVAFIATRESLPASVGLALGISGAICLAAELLGATLRQWEALRHRTARLAIMLALSVSALVAVLVGINVIRRRYLASMSSMLVDDALTLGFVALNFAILVGAIVLAYLSRDPVPGFVRAKARRDAAEAGIARAEQALDKANGDFVAEQDGVTHSGHTLLSMYRRINHRGRAAVPAYFTDASLTEHLPAFSRYEAAFWHAVADDLRGDPASVTRTVRATLAPRETRALPGRAASANAHASMQAPLRLLDTPNPTTDAA